MAAQSLGPENLLDEPEKGLVGIFSASSSIAAPFLMAARESEP